MTWSTLHYGQTEWTGDPRGAATEQPALGPQATIQRIFCNFIFNIKSYFSYFFKIRFYSQHLK